MRFVFRQIHKFMAVTQEEKMNSNDVRQIVLTTMWALRQEGVQVEMEDGLANRVTARLEPQMDSLLPVGGGR